MTQPADDITQAMFEAWCRFFIRWLHQNSLIVSNDRLHPTKQTKESLWMILRRIYGVGGPLQEGGLCPGCGVTKLTLVPMNNQRDHFYDRTRRKLVEMWILCIECHKRKTANPAAFETAWKLYCERRDALPGAQPTLPFKPYRVK